jgi:metal-dependent amidase/aminoacylase/carboxypeptidase family protein
VRAPPILREITVQVEALAPALLALSHRIHAHPELGHEERQAATWCAELLCEHGFEVTAPFGGMETAFRARVVAGVGHAIGGSDGGGRPGPDGGPGPGETVSALKAVSVNPRPAIAFLAEYDALPGIGHACGHNIIGASAVGAGIALARALEKLSLDGDERLGRGNDLGHKSAAVATVLVDGTPAEETMGGKVALVDQGFYGAVDAALTIHPYHSSSAGSTCLGVKRMTFSFHGRAAHAAAEPEKGVNALDAVIQTFNNVNALRQHTRPDARIHGIITHGGQASNIVPDFAQAVFSVRSADRTSFVEIVEKVVACARGAALATGALLEVAENQTYEPIRPNRVLTRLALEAMACVGIGAEDATGQCFPASTDVGNVSQVVPAITPLLKVGAGDAVLHHPGFAAEAGSASGDAAVLAGAKILALMGARLVLESELLQAVRAEFAADPPIGGR